ncbi:hypothetical protein ACP70R_012040 [Stipagrostis hirtigluma subsp. patula]
MPPSIQRQSFLSIEQGSRGIEIATKLNRKTSVAQDTRPISLSAPCHEAKKKRHMVDTSSTPKLLEDLESILCRY